MKAKTMVTKGLLLKMASEQRDLFLDALRCLIALSTWLLKAQGPCNDQAKYLKTTSCI